MRTLFPLLILIKRNFFSASIPNTLIGTDQLADELIHTLNKYKLSHIIVILEATGFFHFHLATSLSTNEILLQSNIQVFCVNPRMTKNYTQSFNDENKNDHIDAWFLADFARVGRTVGLKPFRGAQFVGLQRLTRHRVHLAELVAKEKLYLTNNIFLKFSGLSAVESNDDKPFSTLYGVTSQDILISEDMSPDDIVEMDIESIIDYIQTVSKNSFVNPEETAKLLKQAARNSYRLDQMTSDMLSITIASSFTIINTFEKEMKQLEKSIEKLSRGLFGNQLDILMSIKGVGLTTAAGILAEIQDITFFKDHNALAKYAGITWSVSQSGNKTKENTPISNYGNDFLKHYIKTATNQARRYVPYFHQFYKDKYNQSSKHKHQRAINLTSRKFILRIHSMLKNGTLYSDNNVGAYHK